MTRRILIGSLLLMACAVCLAPSRRLGGAAILATDWSQRVVANGGAVPSQQTIQCMETLRLTLIGMGLTNKLYTLCVFVPDSVIAASTPLFKHKGSDPWTNFFFAQTNLNIDGLKGDGIQKAFDTGVLPNEGGAFTDGALN